MITDSPLVKLIRLCSSISSDSSILSELKSEIESKNNEKFLTKMVKISLKHTNLDSIGIIKELLPVCFQEGTITELDLFSSSTLGIKCFFMSKGTYFPIHDHPNEVVVTSVLHGSVRYLLLDKVDEERMKFSKKGTGKPGDLMFNTSSFRNAHTIFAEENSVILDIFMIRVGEPGYFYKVIRYDKEGKIFHVKKDYHVSFLTRSWKMMNNYSSRKV